MDATAYLTRQGWLGAGHSLHPTGRGIRKPLLVSRKLNVLGVGKKKHDAHADQWWARAFDNGLKNLEVGRSESKGATESVKGGAWGQLDTLKAGGQKWAGTGGLYAGFVRGEGLSGTITPEAMRDGQQGGDDNYRMESACSGPERKKRKRETEGRMDQNDESQRKRARKSKKAAAAIAKDATSGLCMTMNAAVVVTDDSRLGSKAQIWQQEEGTSVKTLRDGNATDVEPVRKAGRQKRRRRKDSSFQDTMDPPKFTAKTAMVGSKHSPPVDSSLNRP